MIRLETPRRLRMSRTLLLAFLSVLLWSRRLARGGVWGGGGGGGWVGKKECFISLSNEVLDAWVGGWVEEKKTV